MLNIEKLKSDILDILLELSQVDDPEANHKEIFSQELSKAIEEFVKSGTVIIPPGTPVAVDPITHLGTVIDIAEGSIE